MAFEPIARLHSRPTPDEGVSIGCVAQPKGPPRVFIRIGQVLADRIGVSKSIRAQVLFGTGSDFGFIRIRLTRDGEFKPYRNSGLHAVELNGKTATSRFATPFATVTVEDIEIGEKEITFPVPHDILRGTAAKAKPVAVTAARAAPVKAAPMTESRLNALFAANERPARRETAFNRLPPPTLVSAGEAMT